MLPDPVFDAAAGAARATAGLDLLIDVAPGACLALRLGAPGSYADAFRRLQGAGIVEPALADRLARAAGFRNVVAHAYESLDLKRVHRAAADGPDDLLKFLACLKDHAR